MFTVITLGFEQRKTKLANNTVGKHFLQLKVNKCQVLIRSYWSTDLEKLSIT